MATRAKEVFLSYGREPEVSAFVKQLKTDLEARGITAWLDVDDIPAGSDWHGAIGTGLQQSRALVAVVTTKYLNSKFCTNELYAASSDQKDIFPILMENVDFNSSERARGVKYVIGSLNWTLFGTGYDYGTAVERLVQGMRRSGLGGGVASSTDEGPVTSLMNDLHLSPGTYPTPSAPPPPNQTPPTYSSPLPSAYYSPGRGPTANPHFYPYSPPQGQMAGYGPLPPTTGYPYPYPTHTPPHLTPSYPHYQQPPYPPSGPALPVTPMRGGVTPPPPPYTPEATDGAEMEPSPTKHPLPDTVNPSPSAPTAIPTPSTPHQPSTSLVAGGNAPPPTTPSFKVGMKLEATDRRFPYYVCVATIMDRRDSEVLVHFDGWGPEYDYWCPAGSLELHPPGWCHTHHWELQTPLNQPWSSWEQYLDETDSPATPNSLFNQSQLAAPGSLLFKKGMKLEAKDRQHPSMICVATISDIKDGRLLIHFDGWTTRYDYWCRPESTDIHPPHWCRDNHIQLHPPKGYFGPFKWSEYLRQPGPVPAPAFIFTKEQRAVPSSSSPPPEPSAWHSSSSSSLGGFKPGMRLEAKDRQYPTLVCVATVTAVRDSKLLIHFDGWGAGYDYLCEPDSTDIHPVGWCKRKKRELQKPDGHAGRFEWNRYLSDNGYEAAPANLFTPAQKN